jgi:hypothetical protein
VDPDPDLTKKLDPGLQIRIPLAWKDNCVETLMSCFPSFLDSPLDKCYLLVLLLNH